MSFISQIETGKKSVPPEYVDKISEWLTLSHEDISKLKLAAEIALRPVKIVPLTALQAAVACELARVIGKLGAESCEKILSKLREEGVECLDPSSKSDAVPPRKYTGSQ